MTRRGWWLLILGWLIPGSAQALAGSRRLGRFGLGTTLLLWTLLIALAAGLLLWPAGTLTILLFPVVMIVAGALIVGYGVLWIVLGIDTLRLVRLVKVSSPSRYLIAILAVIAMVLTGSGAAYAAPRLFAGSNIGSLLPTGFPVAPVDGYYNILLLGADSGEGRDSMRFDSISVVSINAESGAVTITGIPRDMPNVPFSEGSPMQALYPNGFESHDSATCGWNNHINNLTNAVEYCREDRGEGLYPGLDPNFSRPAIEATKDAAEAILGIQIQFHVFIDMDGFAALVDALGGVEIEVTERLPKGGGPAYEGQPADEWAIGWIEPGVQHMDGDTAQWYARSRYTTNDWDRMERQRQLQQAILDQFTPETVLSRFEQIVQAGDDLVQTDIPQSMTGAFIELGAKARTQPFASIELTPAGGVDAENPDFEQIRGMVHDALYPPSPTPTP